MYAPQELPAVFSSVLASSVIIVAARAGLLPPCIAKSPFVQLGMQNIKAKIPPLERQDFRFGRAGGILPRAHKQSTGLFVTAVAVALFESHPHKYHAKKPKERENAFFRFLAERVGFEPTVPLLVHLISSQGRYNHFDTAPDRVPRYYNSFPVKNQAVP